MLHSRRRIVTSALASLALMVSFLVAAPSASAATPADYDAVRLRMYNSLTGGPSYSVTDPSLANRLNAIGVRAQTLWDTLDTSTGRTSLWADLPGGTGDSDVLQQTYGRVYEMALAVETRGTSVSGSAALRADIISALDWLNTNWYNTTITKYGNWYAWELGVPMYLNDTTVLLYQSLSAAQRTSYMNAVNRFTWQVTYDGANGAWQAWIMFARSIIAQDAGKLGAARTAIVSLLADRTDTVAPFANGVFADGSYIEHRGWAYTGGYGVGYVESIAKVLAYLVGSPWAITDPATANAVRWVFETYAPVIYHGGIFYSTTGRLNTWAGPQEQIRGHIVIEAIMRLIPFASANDALKIRRQIKEWLLTDSPISSFATDASISGILTANSILSDNAVTPAGETASYRQFPIMERPTVRRPGYAFTVATSSSRIGTFEVLNVNNVPVENLKGWHTGDGMTYLYTAADAAQFQDNFWPTVDSYRLPGTTVLKNTTGQGNVTTGQDWVGGTDINGLYGATGMQLHPPGKNLTAKKSWFMFDNEVVALGADINSTGTTPVETIVEDRMLNSAGDNALVINGTTKPASLGWSESVAGVNWANLAGPTAASGIGYYFPLGATVDASRTASTGAWADLNSRVGFNDPTPFTRNYAKLVLNHGAAVTGGSYAYVLLPNQTATQTASYASNPDIKILANSSSVQAVRDSKLGVIGANFWQDGTSTLDASTALPNFITVNAKSSVMTQQTGNRLDVSVSDPTQLNTGQITVTINQTATSVGKIDPGVAVTSLSPITFTADVNGRAGSALHVSFSTPSSISDGLEDWSKSSTHSAGWTIDGAGDATAYFNGDTARAIRTSNTTQSVTYRLDGVNQFTARVYAIGGFANKVAFSTSPDGVVWTTAAATGSTPVNSGGSWYRSDFTPTSDLPAGTNFVKVELSSDSRVYTPQLAQIDLRTSMRDNLDDWTQSTNHTAGWTIAGSGDSELYFAGDTARAFRSGSNTAQSITYQLDGMTTFTARVSAIEGFAGKVTFSTSPDGTTFTPVTATGTTPTSTGGSWYASDFTPSAPLPSGTRYLKVEFANDGRVYSPALGSITIR